MDRKARWQNLIHECLQRRLREEHFSKVVKRMSSKHPIKGYQLAGFLLATQRHGVDPLVLVWMDELLDSRQLDSFDVLSILYQRSKLRDLSTGAENERTSKAKKEQWAVNVEVEAIQLEQLTRGFQSGRRPVTQSEVRQSLRVVSEWMSSMAASNAHTNENLLEPLGHQVADNCDSLGSLVIAMLENPRVAGVVGTALSKVLRERLSTSLSAFLPYWAQFSPHHGQLISRLEVLQKLRNLYEIPKDKGSQEAALNVTAELQIQSVMDLPLIHARAGLFVFIDAIASCPLTDDALILSYLQMRYKGDIQSSCVGLIVSSFDALASAVERNESLEAMFPLRSFLINKVPHLLSSMSAVLFASSSNPEFCIGQAMTHLDHNVFPAPGFGMMNNAALQDVRQEFLFACNLHSLVPAESIEALLGEQPFMPPPTPEKRYSKEALIQQSANDMERVGQLIKELDAMEGNAGAIAHALTDIIRTACSTKDTMSLKLLCNLLSGRPQALDVMLQFSSPSSILQPLCNLLDAWRYEDDQGEYQPVYDEFASIFLLVLAFVYRYGFDYSDLGITQHSFVSKYISQGDRSYTMEELSKEQQKQLTTWVKGLFDTDGITDEVTAVCRPQQFYLLVPTLFHQTVRACDEGVLALETLKSGLEYLLEPFLLPSLVGAVRWITTHFWKQSNQNLDTVMLILQRATRCPAAPESQAMHTTIMAIIAERLYRGLQSLRRAYPDRSDVGNLIEFLQPHLGFTKDSITPPSDIRNLLSQPGSLEQAFRHTLDSLITWSTNATVNITQPPPPYTHRQLAFTARELGAKKLVRLLLDEIKARTASQDGTAPLAIDIATAMICAPATENSPIGSDWSTGLVDVPNSHQGSFRLNLRNALEIEFDNASSVMKTDTLLADSIVRLHRRVYAQLTIAPEMIATQGIQVPTMLPELDVSATVAPSTVTQPLDLSTAMDVTIGLSGASATGMAMDLDPVANGMGILGAADLGGNDDDVFAGLGLDDALDFSNMQ